uniref:Uncharacterized protein n=1 Tax=Vitis vinifera TaxID=29760 RepID=F6HPH0_VITVI
MVSVLVSGQRVSSSYSPQAIYMNKHGFELWRLIRSPIRDMKIP